MAGITNAWRVLLADGSEVAFGGFVKSVGMPIEREGLVLVDFSIRVSEGMPTFTKATAGN